MIWIYIKLTWDPSIHQCPRLNSTAGWMIQLLFMYTIRELKGLELQNGANYIGSKWPQENSRGVLKARENMQIQKPWRIQVGPQPAMGSHILVRWLKRGHLHVLHEMIMSKNSVYTFNAWKKDFRCRNDSSKEWFLSFSKYSFFLFWNGNYFYH